MRIIFLLLALRCYGSIGTLNHNPGNISTFNVMAWDGAIGIDHYRHLKFVDDVHGLRAIQTNLRIYKNKHHIKTIYGLVWRWLPKKDSEVQHNEYIHFICERMGGLDGFKKLDFTEPCTCARLSSAIVSYENGENPYPLALYQSVFGCQGLGNIKRGTHLKSFKPSTKQ